MGRIDIDVDLNGVDKKIEQAIKEGVRDSDQEIYKEGTNVAKSKLRQEGAIFKGELINSFTFDVTSRGKVRIVEISNVADHAAPMEEGAEYDRKGPPIQNLLPWVRTKLADWQVSEKWVSLAQEHLTLPKSELQRDPQLYGKAFWLQQHIKHQGLDARRFMEAMEEFLEQNADDIVADEINKALRKKL